MFVCLCFFFQNLSLGFIRNILKFRRFQHFLFRTYKQLQSQNGTTRPRPDTRVDELNLPSLAGHARQEVFIDN